MEEAFRTSTGPNQSVLLVSSDIALVALLEQALPTVLLQARSAAEAQSFFWLSHRQESSSHRAGDGQSGLAAEPIWN